MDIATSALVYMKDESIPVGYDEEDTQESLGIADNIDDLPGNGRYHTAGMIIPPLDKDGETVKLANRFRYYQRSAAERERDFTVISKLYLEGKSHGEIVKALAEIPETHYQLSTATIAKEVQRMLRMWQLTYLADMNKAKVRELMKLDHMEEELWLTWEKSKEDIIEHQQTVVIGKNEADELADEVEEGLEDADYDEEGVAYKTKSGYKDGPRAKVDGKIGRERRRVKGGGEAGSQSGKNFTRTRIFEKRISSYGDIRILEQIRLTIEMRAKILGLITNKSQVDVSWRKEAQKIGLDPGEIIDSLTQKFIEDGKMIGENLDAPIGDRTSEGDGL